MMHSPRITRSQAPSRTNETEEPPERRPTEAEVLRTALDEIRQLREERLQQQLHFEAEIQQRDEELRRLQQRISTRETENQLSLSSARACGDTRSRENCVRAELGFKLKPDTFDGTVSLREYFSQFNLIARANGWDDSVKTVALASSLRGKARSVLETVQDVACLEFAELKSKLELRFGEGHLSQNYYVQFTNRKQKFGEDLATLGAELDRLVRLAYPECPHEIRDKIACAQFISAIFDNFVKRTLQLENITSLNLAIERAKTVKMIQGEGIERKKGNFNRNFSGGKKKDTSQGEKTGSEREGKGKQQRNFGRKNWSGSKFGADRRECWTCGKVGHFRSDCPQEKGNSV